MSEYKVGDIVFLPDGREAAIVDIEKVFDAGVAYAKIWYSGIGEDDQCWFTTDVIRKRNQPVPWRVQIRVGDCVGTLRGIYDTHFIVEYPIEILK